MRKQHVFLWVGGAGLAWWLWRHHRARVATAVVASPVNQARLANAAMMQPGGVVQPLTYQAPAGQG